MITADRALSRHVRPAAARGTERRIVVLKSGGAYRRCASRLRAIGARPVMASAALRMLCCHADRGDDWKLLKRHPQVAYVEKDAKVSAHVLPASPRKAAVRAPRASARGAAAPWNVRRVQSPQLWPRTRGGGVKLAILDTGIARHPDLRIAGGVNTRGGRSYADDNGHGTHVAGIAAAAGTKRLYGNAPQARLYAVKALDRNGSGFVSDIVKGIDWCIANGIRVINMSFGMPGGSQALHDALKRARRKGIVLVASAGNDGPRSGGIDAPARYPETLAVAATTSGNRAAPFSSRGRGIGVAAPGVNIVSTWLNGQYAILSGTSMSAPHVAGGSALLRAALPKLGPSALGARLRGGARRIPGGRTAVGAGLLQVAAAAGGQTATGRKAVPRKPLIRRGAAARRS